MAATGLFPGRGSTDVINFILEFNIDLVNSIFILFYFILEPSEFRRPNI